MALNNGIWDYTEADTVAPTFSELLNLLGDSVRDRFTALLTDSGWQTSGATPAAGVTINDFAARKVGSVAAMRATVTIASLVIPTNGDVGNTTLLTLPPGFVPTLIQGIPHAGVGRGAFGIIAGGGLLQLAAMVPDATQTASVTVTNLQLSFGGTYLLG